MKKSLLVLIFIYGASNFPLRAEVPSLAGREVYVPGQVIVRFNEKAVGPDRTRFLSAFRSSRNLNHPDLFKVVLEPGTDVRSAVDQIMKDPAVKYAQPNYRYYALGCVPPADTYYAPPMNWPLLKVSAPQAWNLMPSCPPGSSSVTVAVLDSGISRLHPDLVQVPLVGYNAVSKGDQDPSCVSCAYTNSPVADSGGCTASMDDYGHGTYVAGIIGATWNSSNPEASSTNYPDCNNTGFTFSYPGSPGVTGVGGLAPGIVLLAVKVLDCTGSGTTDSIVNGTNYAVAHGARVLNFSLGSPAGGGLDPAEKEALDNAFAQNCVIVASSGNESNLPTDLASLDFPAAYLPVIAVGATDQNDNVAFYSNGGNGLDLVAPGGSGALFTGDAVADSANKIFSSILNPLPSSSVGTSSSCGFEPMIGTSLGTDPDFAVAAGTSAAAPFVSATAALILSLYPNLTHAQVEDRIINNTDSLNGGAGWDAKSGYGRLDVYKALLDTSPVVTPYLKTFNSPNPFYTGNIGSTNITLVLEQPAPVELFIYDPSGEVVLHKNFDASQLNDNPGNPQFKSFYVPWDGRNGAGKPVVTGIYFYSVKANGKIGRNKIALVQGSK